MIRTRQKSLICKAHLQIDTALILLRRNITRPFKKLHYPTEVTEVTEIKDDLYVDKMIARGDISGSHINDRDGNRTFHQAGFKLHK